MRIPDATLRALLQRWPVGRLGTITPDGRPHVLPVVFVADGECVYTPVDGKRKRPGRLARVRNVEAHGHASLLLDEYDARWERLWWLRLDGRAWVERLLPERRARLQRLLLDKYPQYQSIEPFPGTATAVVLAMDRVTGWTQSGDAGLLAAAVAGPSGAPEGQVRGSTRQ